MGWGLAAVGEVSKYGDGKLTDAMAQKRFGFGGGAFCEAGFEGCCGCGIGEEEVFDDFLDAPLLRIADGTKLGLGGVQPAERMSEFLLKMFEYGVHLGRTKVHRLDAGRYRMAIGVGLELSGRS